MHQKKSILFALICLLCVCFSMYSQQREGRKKVKVLKVSYITEKLNLTEKEAEKFWPIYNKYEKRMHEAYARKKAILKRDIKNSGGIDNLTERQAEDVAKNILELKKVIVKQHAKLQEELSKVISYKKIVKLEVSEREFERQLFRRYKNQRGPKTKKENE